MKKFAEKIPKWYVIALFSIFILRILFVDVLILKNVPASPPQDPMEYKMLATNLLEHGRFTQDISDPNNFELLRTPGYPVFFAALLVVDHSGYLVLFVQQILSLLTVCLIYLIIYRLTLNKKLAAVSSLVFFLWPYEILWSRMTMSEELFTFLLILTACVIIFRRGWRSDVIAGVLTGLAILVRPQGVLAFGAIWFATFFQGFSKRIWLYPLVVFLCLLPWMARNYSLTNSFVISSSGDLNMIYSGIAGREARGQLNSINVARDKIISDDIGTSIHRNWYFSSAAYPMIEGLLKSSHVSIGTIVTQNLVCSTRVWSLSDFDMLLRRFPGIVKFVFLSAYFLFMVFCAMAIVFGFYVAVRKRKMDRLAVYILTVGVALSGTLVNMCISYGRMTIPLLPFVLVATALGKDEMIACARKYLENKVQ